MGATASSTTTELKEKLHPVFTSIAYTVFLLVIVFVSDFVSWFNEATIGYYPVRWFIPYIYFFLVVELLGRISPRFRLNSAQIIALLIPLSFAAGCRYIYMGERAGGHVYSWLDYVWQYTIKSQLYSQAAKTAVLTLPSWLIPHNDFAINVVYYGLQAGQSIPWDVWMGPIITWSLTYISMSVFQIGIGFLLTGPQWTEVERLVFPLSIPAVYSIEQLVTRDEKGKSRLFSKESKLFWAFFAIGFIESMSHFASDVFPILRPLGILPYGDIDFPIFRSLNPLLPGADFHAVFILPQAILEVLLPYGILISAVIGGFLVNFLLNPLLVALGLLPYNPGWDYFAYARNAPYSYYVAIMTGMIPGLAIWLIWAMRERIKAIFRALVGKENSYIGDLPVRQAAWITLGSLLLLFVIWVAAGMPFIIGLIVITIYLLYQIAAARFMNEVWIHQPGPDYCWTLYYPIGATLGYWNWSSPNVNSQALVASNALLVLNGGGYDLRTAVSTPFSTLFYQMSRKLKASIKQMYFWYIIVAVLMIPTAIVLRLFMEAHTGAKNLAAAGIGPASGLSYGVLTLSTPTYTGFSWTTNYVVAFLGMALIWILIYLKNFSWFSWFNPAGFILGMQTPGWMFWNSLLALIIKFVTYRVVGPRKTEENIVPAISGFAIGTGAAALFDGLFTFFVSALPTTLAFWR